MASVVIKHKLLCRIRNMSTIIVLLSCVSDSWSQSVRDCCHYKVNIRLLLLTSVKNQNVCEQGWDSTNTGG